MNPFEEQVLKIVRTIPPGRVMSYGQIALYTGNPNHSREVGHAMRTLGHQSDFPWWRVLNSAGHLSINGNPDANAHMQQELLMKEGVEFPTPFKLDMDRYRYYAEQKALESLGCSEWIIKSALYKYGPVAGTESLGI